MANQRLRQFHDPVAGHDEPMGEVTVVLAHEVAFVEQADLDGGVACDEQGGRRGRADVLRSVSTLGQWTIQIRIDGFADEMEPRVCILDQVRTVPMYDDGEHGDGLVRSMWNEKVFGTTLYNAFRDVKRAFDPKGIMNPGKVL